VISQLLQVMCMCPVPCCSSWPVPLGAVLGTRVLVALGGSRFKQLAVGHHLCRNPSPSHQPTALCCPGPHGSSRQGVEQVGDAVTTHFSTAAEKSLIELCLTARSILTTPTGLSWCLGGPEDLQGRGTAHPPLISLNGRFLQPC